MTERGNIKILSNWALKASSINQQRKSLSSMPLNFLIESPGQSDPLGKVFKYKKDK